MPSSTKSTIALALTLLFTHIKCDPTPLIPYLDTQCKQPITDIWSGDFNSKVNIEYEFANDKGFPAFTSLDNLTFNGAENTDKPGYTVYWQVGDIDKSCSVALMLGYSQQYYGRLPEVLPPGNVIMATNQPGCFYSFIPENAFLTSTFCCGQYDCEALSPGYSPLYKRDLQETEETSKTAKDVYSEEEKIPKRIHQRQTKFLDDHATKEPNIPSTPKRDISDAFDTTNCTITLNDPVPEAGKQSLVANPNVCTGGPCSFAISHGVTVSTTFSTSTDTTITNSAGGSLSITSGEDFIIKNEVTFTAQYSFAKAVSKSTGTAITNSTTVTVTNTLGQQEGTTAFVTFTPTYLCWYPKISCGGDKDAYMDYCEPQFEADGQTLQGDYTVVYTV